MGSFVVGGGVGLLSILKLIATVLFLFSPVIATRSLSVDNGMVSGGDRRPMVKTDILVRKASGNAVASLSNGFVLSGIPSGKGLIISCVNCTARALPVGKGADFDVILTRSARALSRIIIMNCNIRGGIGLAKSITSIGKSTLRRHPMISTARDLRNLIPNLSMDGKKSKHPNTANSLDLHNRNGLSKGSTPCMLMSNIRVSLSSMGPGSVRGVSMLGSTTTYTVCKTHTTCNIVLIAAGRNRRKGVHTDCRNALK